MNPAPESLAAAMAAERIAATTASVSRADRTLLVQAAALAHGRALTAATAMATELAEQLGCSRVIVGRLRHAHVEAYAVSQGNGERLTGEAYELPSQAMEEALLQDSVVHMPDDEQGGAPIRIAHQRWLQRQGGAVMSAPLVQDGCAIGALALEWRQAPADVSIVARQLDDIAAFCGPVLGLMLDRERSLAQRAGQSLLRLGRRLRDPAQRRWRIAAAALALALLGLTLLPVTHNVAGSARLVGSQQRVLVAPAEGYLRAVHVRPGDTVKAGQLLAEMADQELLLERQRWSSDLNAQEAAYASALARSERTEMVAALSKAEAARSELAQIEARLARSRIVAPFDGIVLDGDLSQRAGAPLQRGETLLVLAPDASYRVVVAIDERDVARVRVGQRGALSLASRPWQPIALKVERLTPVARADEGRNVFEVEARLLAAPGDLRPGLAGVARVSVGDAPLLWQWTHKAVDWLRLQAWRWWS